MDNISNPREIWEDCREEAYQNGDFFIDDWTELCKAISEFSRKRKIEDYEDIDVYYHPEHLAFIEGAKWAFKYAKNQSMGKEIERT